MTRLEIMREALTHYAAAMRSDPLRGEPARLLLAELAELKGTDDDPTIAGLRGNGTPSRGSESLLAGAALGVGAAGVVEMFAPGLVGKLARVTLEALSNYDNPPAAPAPVPRPKKRKPGKAS